ncbi:glycosyltransferase family 39 protein [Streptomyces sp. H10-C2]|uniref:glycosyltransferase family 39 protein n=1 Tax=unclassified Streptomyces TaxID=2593676 RepID=UPI0024BABEE3|nr:MULTISPECIES: glycosyltransferase family 39 protein [unclassified Streptomyces]MDJ0343551.1 glycosyltransferase family 39 protein [Streptomyces sp. PH10-H1]MDJ0368873.1 glycosyltransferase family 39 protein [Streptomyces sp. H10-C2]
MEDAPFTVFLLLAADAALRAAHSARLRPLISCAVWVGLAFQTKMLEAWAVLPTLGAVYLISAPTALGRRVTHTAVAAAVTVSVSASWVLVVALTPAADRPHIDGTTSNSPVSMVVGYNFLNRFPQLGLTPQATGSVDSVPGGPAAAKGLWGDPHRPPRRAMRAAGARCSAPPHASQTGWLYPAAALSLGCGLLWRRRMPCTSCAPVPATAYGGTVTDAADGAPLQLYRCAPAR